MLKVKWRLKVVASLKILQYPVEQLRMTAVRAGGPVEVHQLAPVRDRRGKRYASYDFGDRPRSWNLLYPQTRQQREYLRGADPFPGVDQFTAELLGALDIKALRPRPFDHLLQPGDRRHRGAQRILRGAIAARARAPRLVN